MSATPNTFHTELEHRLELASRPENMGDNLLPRDYVWLSVVTIVVPAALMVAGWYL